MTGSSTLSFRVEDDIIDALDAAADHSRASRSKIAREALLLGVEELTDADGDVSVPEHVAHDAKIKRLISRNKRTRRAGKFRSEFSKQLKRSFRNNEHPEEFRRSVAGYIEEAEDMGELPQQVADETGCDTFSEWVQDKLDYYAAAYQASTFDSDPIENPLGSFEGLQNARSWLTEAQAITAVGHEDGYGPETIRKKRTEIARGALREGVVPEQIEQQARKRDVDATEVVVSAAFDLIESSNAQIEPADSDTNESDL